MSKKANSVSAVDLDKESTIETLKRMIRYTKTEADKDGRTFCSYCLDMALQSLDDGSEDVDAVLKGKVTRLIVGQENLENARL